MVCMQRIGACLTHAAHCSLARPRHRPKPYLLPQCNGRSARALSGALQQGRACTRCSKTRCTYSSSAERPLGKTCAARTAPARRPGRAPIVHAQSPASVRCHPRRRGAGAALAGIACASRRARACGGPRHGPGQGPPNHDRRTRCHAACECASQPVRSAVRQQAEYDRASQTSCQLGRYGHPCPFPGRNIQAQRGAAPAP